VFETRQRQAIDELDRQQHGQEVDAGLRRRYLGRDGVNVLCVCCRLRQCFGFIEQVTLAGELPGCRHVPLVCSLWLLFRRRVIIESLFNKEQT
jgi:hypothetical protein